MSESELSEWREKLRDSSSPRLEREAAEFLAKLEQGTRVLVLGQCSLERLVVPFLCEGLRRGLVLNVQLGQFDNVLQDLLTLQPEPGSVVVLVPWHDRLLAPDERTAEQRIEQEMVLWQSVFGVVEKAGLKLVMVGYDWVRPGPEGHLGGGAKSLVQALNSRLRERLPTGSFFLDLELVSGGPGRDQFYDSRSQAWFSQPFSEKGLGIFARHLVAAVRALTVGPKKVLVLDLDNTLWGGEVGELGAAAIRLSGAEGKAFLAFQTHLLQLKKRGVILAVCSKNDPEVARSAFRENKDLYLSLEDFAGFEASWEPKVDGLTRLAQQLRLNLDSFVFFDDDARERGQIRHRLPQVEVVEVTGDPTDYITDLEAGLWFQAASLTAEDLERSDQYQAEQSREEAKSAVMDLGDYLKFLDMTASLEPVNGSNLERVVQLLAKTNQFNLTTRRYGAAEVERLAALPGAYMKALRLQDRFGAMGLVAVLMAVPEKDALRIDVWLMSCRVLARTVEHFFFADLVEFARANGVAKLVGEYLPTPKNTPVAQLLESLGFSPQGVLNLEGYEPQVSFVRHVIEASNPCRGR